MTRLTSARTSARVAGRLLGTPTATTKTARLITMRTELAASRKALDERVKKLDGKILAALKSEGEADAEGKLRLDTPDFRVQLVAGESRFLDEGKLLDLGVRPTVIEKAKTVKPYEYAKITPKAAASSTEQEG